MHLYIKKDETYYNVVDYDKFSVKPCSMSEVAANCVRDLDLEYLLTNKFELLVYKDKLTPALYQVFGRSVNIYQDLTKQGCLVYPSKMIVEKDLLELSIAERTLMYVQSKLVLDIKLWSDKTDNKSIMIDNINIKTNLLTYATNEYKDLEQKDIKVGLIVHLEQPNKPYKLWSDKSLIDFNNYRQLLKSELDKIKTKIKRC